MAGGSSLARGLGALVGAIGLATVKTEMRAAARRVALAALTAILVTVALSFALAAFTVWLAGEIGTIAALAVVAAIFLLLALIVQVAARLSAGRKPHPTLPPPAIYAPPPAAPPPGVQPGVEPPPGQEIGALAIVAVAGYLLARQMMR